MLPRGTLVNAICSALAFVILLECFASFLSLAAPDEIPKADKTTIKITKRRKSLGFMIQVRLNRADRIYQDPGALAGHGLILSLAARQKSLRFGRFFE